MNLISQILTALAALFGLSNQAAPAVLVVPAPPPIVARAIVVATPTPRTATPAPTPTPAAGVRTSNEANCPPENVAEVRLMTGTVVTCMQPPDGDEVFECIVYGDRKWTYVGPPNFNDPDNRNMGCPEGANIAKVDPDVLG